MSVKSIGPYVVAVACVLSILACGTGGDSPTNVAIERASEAQVAAEATTRPTGPSITQQLSTDRASQAQRASKAVSPTPSTRGSASTPESTDALFDTNTSPSGDYQLPLLAIARNEKTEAVIALHQFERLSTSLTLRENFQLEVLAPNGLCFCESSQLEARALRSSHAVVIKFN